MKKQEASASAAGSGRTVALSHEWLHFIAAQANEVLVTAGLEYEQVGQRPKIGKPMAAAVENLSVI